MDRSNERSPRVSEQLDHEIRGFVTGSPVPDRVDGKVQEEVGRTEPGRRPLDRHRQAF